MAAGKKFDPSVHEKPHQIRKSFVNQGGFISWVDRYFDARNKREKTRRS